MSDSRLDVYDFDNTATKCHTAKTPGDYNPENNTKCGLSENVVHNGGHFSAVATFHKNPEYVLSYFLPLLKLNDEAIEKKEVELFEHHQFTKFYFRDCPQPFIIATPRLGNYEANLRAMFHTGKNVMLNSLKDAYPPRSEYHYYEDTEHCYDMAVHLRYFHCHLMDLSSPELFSFKKEFNPLAETELETILHAFIALEESKDGGSVEPVQSALRSLSFYATDSSGEKEPKLTQIQVARHVLKFLESESSDEIEGLELLYSGKLGEMITDWEARRESLDEEVTLNKCIDQLRKNRIDRAELFAKYTSDDDDYEDVSYITPP